MPLLELESHREPSALQRGQPHAQQPGEDPPGTSLTSEASVPQFHGHSAGYASRRRRAGTRPAGKKAERKPGGVMEQLLCGAFAGVGVQNGHRSN